MSESILKALMRLFAIIANFDNEGMTGREVVARYLKQQLNQELLEEYLKLFDEFVALHHSKRGKKRVSANSVKVLAICEQINEELRQEQKLLVLLQLLEFINYDEKVTDIELEFVQTVAEVFNISKEEYEDCKALIFETADKIPNKENILIIDSNDTTKIPGTKHIKRENLSGYIIVLFIKSTNMYAFGYVGNDTISLNSQPIDAKKIYVMAKGSALRSHKFKTVYYSDIVGQFLKSSDETEIVFTADDIEFKFKNSENGIQPFTFSEQSGQLIGVMGGSGAGKSTLLNVFNGNLIPKSGTITINGYDIHEDSEELEGIIGFVPQDDLLIEELTVYQNLYYNAKLCFDNYSDEQIDEAVNKTLKDLDLYEIRHLIVGNPLKKIISGGQRKRVNIALELIREPSVLFVDEPTSGLSSMDSEMVMDLLKEITLKGKLVITNIHQPSSDIYKLFDKLLIMDKGGHPVYYGNPVEAVVYFKKMANHVNADESECPSCGNVNPEQVLQILEAKVVDEYGKLTRNRKVSEKEWYQRFKEKIQPKNKVKEPGKGLPKSDFKIPGGFKQFLIFTIRDLKAKITNTQYLLISLLEAPALAFVLGYFTKFIAGTQSDPDAYVFSENENLVGYLFMCIVVSLFIGMTVSAEEIIKDRKILQRESFLNLSKLSYLNSKVLLMFTLSAIQMITFVLIGNFILEIKGMTMSYFIVLFSTAAFANITGLNISAALNSVVTIYILIPFLLVPQLLLSGTIVKFDKLHKSIVSEKYVSVLGDMMASRWAFEALAVNQFKNNKYNKHFYEIDRKQSQAQYISVFLIANINNKLMTIQRNLKNDEKTEETERYLRILRNEVKRISDLKKTDEYKHINLLNKEKINNKVIKDLEEYLKKVKSEYSKLNADARKEKDRKINDLMQELAKKDTSISAREAYLELFNQYQNKNLADVLQKKLEIDYIRETDDRLIQLKDPIYKNPQSNYGRAHFYAPEKKIGNMKIDTFWFNVAVLWLMTLILYITLITNAIKKVIDFGSSIKLFKK